MTTEPQINQLFKHYKGNIYKVLSLAYDETTLQKVVVYQAQYDTKDLGEKPIFSRSLNSWNDVVKKGETTISRFTPVSFPTLQFITGNTNKIKEAKELIPDLLQLPIDLTEIQSLDPKEIIMAKLAEAKALGHRNFFVEDVSYFVDSINYPGPLIKWVNQTIGLNFGTYYDGEPTTLVCSIGYCDQNGKTYFVEGKIKGKTVSARGKSFGFNPIFEPTGTGKTYGEMTHEERSHINHRALAIKELQKLL